MAKAFIFALQKIQGFAKVFPSESIEFCEAENCDLPAHIPFKYFPIIALFREFGVFSSPNDREYVILDVANSVSELLIESIMLDATTIGGNVSLSELKRIQLLNEKLGDNAERIVLNYERRRLKSHVALNSIRRISEENASAGFDIISFSSSSSLALDRFIEVKAISTSGRFFFSAGEYAAAKRFQDRYCIYLVENDKCGDAGYIPIIIENPATNIFENQSNWTLDVANWEISPKSPSFLSPRD